MRDPLSVFCPVCKSLAFYPCFEVLANGRLVKAWPHIERVNLANEPQTNYPSKNLRTQIDASNLDIWGNPLD